MFINYRTRSQFQRRRFKLQKCNNSTLTSLRFCDTLLFCECIFITLRTESSAHHLLIVSTCYQHLLTHVPLCGWRSEPAVCTQVILTAAWCGRKGSCCPLSLKHPFSVASVMPSQNLIGGASFLQTTLLSQYYPRAYIFMHGFDIFTLLSDTAT